MRTVSSFRLSFTQALQNQSVQQFYHFFFLSFFHIVVHALSSCWLCNIWFCWSCFARYTVRSQYLTERNTHTHQQTPNESELVSFHTRTVRTHSQALVFAALLAQIAVRCGFRSNDQETLQKIHIVVSAAAAAVAFFSSKLNILVVVIWIWFMFTTAGFIVLVCYYRRWRSSETEVPLRIIIHLAVFIARASECGAQCKTVVVWASRLNYNYFHKFPSFMHYLSSFSIKWFNIPQHTNAHMPTAIGGEWCKTHTKFKWKQWAKRFSFVSFLGAGEGFELIFFFFGFLSSLKIAK